MEFTGKLGKYKIIETEDQTKTVWSEYFNEACHNLVGAYAETIYNYILGCSIPDQLTSDKDVHVFDVGFGIGVGLTALIDEAKKQTLAENKKITYTSIELDEDLFLWSVQTNFPNENFKKIENYYTAEIKISSHIAINARIFIGDGRLTVPQAAQSGRLPKFTAIFQDAFSPGRNPALWTVEWFGNLKEISDPEVYMSTYSSSVSIRKSMIVSGWIIENAKGFGAKRTMTKARLHGEISPALAAELSRSPALELRDNSAKIE